MSGFSCSYILLFFLPLLLWLTSVLVFKCLSVSHLSNFERLEVKEKEKTNVSLFSCFPSSYLFVADSGNSRVQILSAGGQFKYSIGHGMGQRVGQLSSPTDVAVSKEAIIFVSDSVWAAITFTFKFVSVRVIMNCVCVCLLQKRISEIWQNFMKKYFRYFRNLAKISWPEFYVMQIWSRGCWSKLIFCTVFSGQQSSTRI